MRRSLQFRPPRTERGLAASVTLSGSKSFCFYNPVVWRRGDNKTGASETSALPSQASFTVFISSCMKMNRSVLPFCHRISEWWLTVISLQLMQSSLHSFLMANILLIILSQRPSSLICINNQTSQALSCYTPYQQRHTHCGPTQIWFDFKNDPDPTLIDWHSSRVWLWQKLCLNSG